MKVKTLIAATVLTAAAVIVRAETKSDYDKEHDFANLKTFDYKQQARPSVKDTHGPNSRWNRLIQEELTKGLTADGYERVQTGDPDFLVSYSMGAQEREDVRSTGYGYPYWGWHRGWGGWGPGFDVWNIPYTQATLVVDIIDAHTNMLVWRGYDTDNIDINKADKTIGKAVDNLVKRFMHDVKETQEGE